MEAMFLRNVGSGKCNTASHPRRWHCSYLLMIFDLRSISISSKRASVHPDSNLTTILRYTGSCNVAPSANYVLRREAVWDVGVQTHIFLASVVVSVVRFMPRPFYPGERAPGTHLISG
jgi:hypothetical protein